MDPRSSLLDELPDDNEYVKIMVPDLDRCLLSPGTLQPDQTFVANPRADMLSQSIPLPDELTQLESTLRMFRGLSIDTHFQAALSREGECTGTPLAEEVPESADSASYSLGEEVSTPASPEPDEPVSISAEPVQPDSPLPAGNPVLIRETADPAAVPVPVVPEGEHYHVPRTSLYFGN